MSKKKSHKKWIILIIFLLIIGIVCAFFILNPKRALTLVIPDLDEISLVKVNIKHDTAYLNIDMTLENKSLFKLTIDTLFYKIALADSQLFMETKALHIRQKPRETSKIEMPLRIPMTKTMGTIRSLKKQDSTYLDIDAYVIYNTVLGVTKIPVTKRIKIKVPVPPQIKVQQMDVEDFNLSDKTVRVNAKIKIINKGEMIDLNIHRLRYRLILGDSLITSDGTYDTPIILKPGKDSEVNIPITVEVNHVFKTAWKFITNQKLKYRILVTGEFDENNFYKKSNIPLKITASGEANLRKKKNSSK